MRISDWSSDVCSSDLSKVDHLIIGGGMANTFLAARGVDVGKSLCEHDLVDTANAIFEAADAAGCTIHLQIGRASCRERVCPYVLISVVAVSLKNKLLTILM